MRQRQGASFHPFPVGGGGHTELMTCDGRDATLIIAISLADDPAENICTVAHEATHAARFLFEYVGEDKPGKEGEAYLIEHIVRHALRELGLP